LKILFIGDVVGRPGRDIVCAATAQLVAREQLDLVVANAENSAAGSGITEEIYRALIAAGVDVITLGDHIYRRKEIREVMLSADNIVKPANYPDAAPGRAWATVTARNGVTVAVFCLLGRLFMEAVDCPFRAADRVLNSLPPDLKVILVDIHAEATSEKQLLGRYLDGRVTAVLGTHTHVPTADETIFPGGTAFQCDVGMTGPYESILGRRIDRVLQRTLTCYPTPFDVATDDVRLSGSIVELNPTSGNATAIHRVVVKPSDLPNPRVTTVREYGPSHDR
jgi:metallophosphoesterase (TIGR00282 family)